MNLSRIFVCGILLLTGCSIATDRSFKSINIHDSVLVKDAVIDGMGPALPIVLETTAECIIKELSKLLVVNDTLVVLDKKLKRITLFDLDGRYISRISHFGRGPGEYISTDDLVYDAKDKCLVILDIGGRKFHYYRLNDTYLFSQSIQPDMGGYKFEVTESYYTFFRSNSRFNKYPEHNIITAKRDFSAFVDHTSKIPERVENIDIGNGDAIVKDHSGIYVLPNFDECLYKIDSLGHIEKVVAFKVADNFLASNTAIWKSSVKDLVKLNDGLMKSGALWHISRILKSGDKFLIWCYIGKRPQLVIYSQKLNKTTVLDNPKIQENLLFEPMASDTKNMYVMLSNSQAAEISSKLGKRVSPTDNPVLIRVSLKNDLSYGF